MSSNGMVSAITSTLRRDKKQQHHANAEDERLLGSSRTISERGHLDGSQPSYGATSKSTPGMGVQSKDYAGEEARLDGNDADVWQSVEGRGLDGRGSIRSVRSYSDRASSIEHTRRHQQLTKSSYTYLKATYLLVPIFTLVGCWALVMLAVYAWPPTSNERRLPPAERPRYPHPFLWPPLIVGVLASITMQALRDPVLIAIRMLPEQLGRMSSRSGSTASRSKSTIRLLLLAALGIFLHTAMQELLRVVALYLCEPHLSTMVTTTRLFQQSYYLGIGWGAAEAFWGITRGWFSGVRLWSDLLDKVSVEPVADPERNMSTSTAQDYATATSQQMESEVVVADDQSSVSSLEDEEDNLLAKIEALQRLRGRKDLEDALGKPFPNIAVAVHILWRLDTILLNLGFTLIVSAFYYNTEPIYHRLSARSSLPSSKYGQTPLDQLKPHRLFPLVVAGVALAHFNISWVWAVGVRRVGLSAVTWGSLVVSLAAFFAGLGSWGGLV